MACGSLARTFTVKLWKFLVPQYWPSIRLSLCRCSSVNTNGDEAEVDRDVGSDVEGASPCKQAVRVRAVYGTRTCWELLYRLLSCAMHLNVVRVLL